MTLKELADFTATLVYIMLGPKALRALLSYRVLSERSDGPIPLPPAKEPQP